MSLVFDCSNALLNVYYVSIGASMSESHRSISRLGVWFHDETCGALRRHMFVVLRALSLLSRDSASCPSLNVGIAVHFNSTAERKIHLRNISLARCSRRQVSSFRTFVNSKLNLMVITVGVIFNNHVNPLVSINITMKKHVYEKFLRVQIA